MLRYIWFYFALINLIAIKLTLNDKKASKKKAWRTKERTLLLVSVLGGSLAMLMTMLVVRHKTKKNKFMVGIPIIISLQVILLVFALNTSLSIRYLTIKSDKIDGQIKLVLVTDLHSCQYGNGQVELINAVLNEYPDVVLLGGDIFDDVIPHDNTMEFLKGITRKVPCYYVTGNHEFWSREVDELKSTLISNGIIVLEGSFDEIEINGNTIRICGLDDPDVDYYRSSSQLYSEQIDDLRESMNTEIYTILLAHRPERILEYLQLKPDLVLSGHAHGGQWVVPVILKNGLFAPNQGLFPKYTNGEYLVEGTKLIVSRGLARETTRVPRIFNRPEIVIITVE